MIRSDTLRKSASSAESTGAELVGAGPVRTELRVVIRNSGAIVFRVSAKRPQCRCALLTLSTRRPWLPVVGLHISVQLRVYIIQVSTYAAIGVGRQR